MRAKNNSGMAFVTVLIAVMFVGLLVSSLAYMAYNNYVSKAMKWQTTDNFYYDEFALEDLSSGLRQKATTQCNIRMVADPTLDVGKVFIAELALAAGVPDDGNYNSSFSGKWVPAYMENVLGVTDNSQFDVSISVSTIPGRTQPLYERVQKDIKFKNVCITVVDKKTNYTTTITTDICIPGEFKAAGIPVNDFSLMTDQPVDWSGGGIMTLTGNLFCMDHALDSSHTTHNGDALTLGNGANVQILGEKSLIIGNVVVGKNSNLTIGGNATISGKLTVEAGAQVHFLGTGVVVGDFDCQGSYDGYYSKKDGLTARADAIFSKTGTYNMGLSSAIADDVEIILEGTGSSDLKTMRFCKGTNSDGWDDTTYVCSNKYGSISALETKRKETETLNAAGSPSGAKVAVRPNSDDFTDQKNSLILMGGNSNSIRQDYTNSTIISTCGSAVHSYDPQSGPVISKMSDADYNACLNTLVGGVWPKIDGNSGQTSTGINFDTTVETAKKGGTDYLCIEYTHLGKETRYMLYNTKTKQSYVPFKYFIRDDADEVIGFAFDSVRNDSSDGGSYQIYYQNWVKE